MTRELLLSTQWAPVKGTPVQGHVQRGRDGGFSKTVQEAVSRRGLWG